MSGDLAVHRLRLSHFRSHKKFEREFDGRPVAIHGANGAGKTNLIEAVSMLSPGRGLRRARNTDISRLPEDIGWKVFAEVSGPYGLREIETGSEGAGRRVLIDGKVTPQVALADLVPVLWLTPAMDRLWTEGAAERRRFLDRTTLSLIPGHGAAAVGYDRALRERNRLLKDQVRDRGWFEALEAQMGRFGAEVSRNRLAAIGRLSRVTVVDAFPVAELGLYGTAWEKEADLVEALRDGRARDMSAGRSLRGPHRDDLSAVYAAKGVEARLCSTGEQKALLISLVLANARAVAEDFGAPPLLLLDEVAAHLDADRRLALFEQVSDLGAQAWMTGTGAELFEGLGDRAQWLALSGEG